MEMKIAIDISPLKSGHFLQHRVRGTGFYIENLKNSLLKYYPENQYNFYTRGKNLSEDVDIVHIPYFEPFFLTLPFKKRFRTVVTVHDLTPLVFPDNFPSGIKGKIKWEIQKNLLRKVNAIITDSENSKKDIIKFTGISDKKIHVVYLAAGEEFKKIEHKKLEVESLRKKYNLPKKFVLYVGDVTWNKNLPRLLKAIKEINIPLVMVGKALIDENFDRVNPWNQDLTKAQQLARENRNIRCLGFVPTEDLTMLYNNATVFVMPSLYEGFGLPLLEAMSCGCPVIASREGSITEIASEAAFYVDAYDIESIARGIKSLYMNINLQKNLSNKGLTQAKRFLWQKTVTEVMQIYEKEI